MSPQEQLAAARSADPLACSWGLYLAPSSGEDDGLLWFSSVEALQAFVAGPLWPALSGVAAPPDEAAELKGLFQGSPALSWALLDQANLRIEPVAQLHWWGSLKQLYEGEDPFAKDLREAWRQSVGRGPQDFSALAPADARAFADFLKDVFS
jgi:hypothetical protein